MTTTQYLEILCNDSPNPCYFVHVKTNEIVFMNQTFQKKFQIFQDYTGKKCHDLLPSITGTCAICSGMEVSKSGFTEHRIFCAPLNRYLRSNSTIIEVNGEELLMTKFFLTAQDQQRILANHSFEEAMTKCIDILSIVDQKEAILGFLKLLTDFYSCKLAFICEFDHENTTLSSKFLWSSTEGETEIPLGVKDRVSQERFVLWLKNDSNRSMITVDSATEPDFSSTQSEILNKHGITNLVLNKLWNKDGSLLGVVGMSNLAEPIYDDRLLKAICHTVMERFNEQSLINALHSLNDVDLLTGFYNRNKYGEKLAELHKNPPNKLGILFVNLNGLRKTNEYFGFEVGDEQIKTTSQILRDYFTNDFYRISGDEFVAFVCDIEKEEFEKKVSELHGKLKEDTNETAFALGHG